MEVVASEDSAVKNYVVGFLLTGDGAGTRVMLIRKNRPAWQAGRLNGIGGHIEAGETPGVAMRREFIEETGVVIDDWRNIVRLTGDGFRLWVFAARTDAATFAGARTMTDEVIETVTIGEIPYRTDVIRNLPMLIAIANDRSGVEFPVVINEAPAVAQAVPAV